MLKVIKSAALVIVTCVGFMSVSNAALASGKVAVVNIEKAVFDTQSAKTQMKVMESKPEYKKSVASLKRLSGEAKAMKARFDKEGAVMSTSQKTKLQADFTSKLKTMKGEEMKLQGMNQAVYSKLMREMGGKLKVAMNAVVKKQRIGLLLDRQAAIHVDPEFDITSLITKRLNASK